MQVLNAQLPSLHQPSAGDNKLSKAAAENSSYSRSTLPTICARAKHRYRLHHKAQLIVDKFRFQSGPWLWLCGAGLCLCDDLRELVPQMSIGSQHSAPHDVERASCRIAQLQNTSHGSARNHWHGEISGIRVVS